MAEKLNIEIARGKFLKMGLRLLDDQIYIDNRTNLKYECIKCGFLWSARLSNVCEGYGCRSCGNLKCRPAQTKTLASFIEEAGKIHGDKYDYSLTFYKNYTTKLVIICPLHGKFWQRPNNHLRGQGCRECGFATIGESKTRHGFCKSKNGKKQTQGYNKYLRENVPGYGFRRSVSTAINLSLKGAGGKNGRSCFDILPYTLQELKEHLESQFESWMNWENHGGHTSDPRRTWWVDHIIPQSKFQFISSEDPEFQRCWSLENLRPLEKYENIRKNNGEWCEERQKYINISGCKKRVNNF